MEKYHTLYADPPWHESGGGKIKRGADRHYGLMKTKDIMTYLDDNGIAPLISPDAHLYLWTTNNFLKDALSVMEAWGFRYVTIITWNKEGNIGLGQYFRGTTEHCLFGVRDRLPYRLSPDGKRQQGRTGLSAPKGKHSEKPAQMRAWIEKVSHPPYLELFAREAHIGWDCRGKECDNAQMKLFEEVA